jgi:transcriptional regulator with XRE-family HTH domain
LVIGHYLVLVVSWLLRTMDNFTDLNSAWQTALSARKLSLRGLARETGISHTYLGRIMAGSALPSQQVRIRLLDYFKGYRAEDLFGPLIPAERAAAGIVCKSCSSTHTIKSGFFRGVQRYCCKDCGSVFINNLAPLHSRLPVEAVVLALEHFFDGEPLDFIRRLMEDSQGIQITVAGLEKMIYRYSLKAVRLAGDITPYVSPRWLLECTLLPGARPIAILDVLDLKTFFLIASDVVPDYAEKDRESVFQRALRITGSTPTVLVLGPGLPAECADVEDGAGLCNIRLTKDQKILLLKYNNIKIARTQMVARRLNFDSIVNCRLICEAWRVSYNFLGGFKPAGCCRCNSWLDIVNGQVTVPELPVVL